MSKNVAFGKNFEKFSIFSRNLDLSQIFEKISILF